MVKTICNNKLLYALWLVLVLIISIGVTTNAVLSLAAFALFLIAALFMSASDAIVLLIALMPYANIFKLGAGSTSLFTLCELFLVLLLVYRRKTLNGSLLVSLSVMLAYVLLSSIDSINVMLIIKVLLNFMLVHYSISFIGKNDVKNIVYLLSFGTLIMMLLSLNEGYLEYLFPYYEDLNYSIDSSGSVTDILRASGFLGDPNYCAVLIISVLALMSVLYYYKDIGLEFWLISIPLATTGIYTYSKSYFLCLVVLTVLLIVFVLFPKHKAWACLSIIAFSVLAALILKEEFEVFNVLFERFESDDLTTGRTGLNDEYLEYIFSDIKVMLFGEGITVDRYDGAINNVHNIYIELLFKMGFVGITVYLAAWYAALNLVSKKQVNIKRKFVNYMPLLFLAVMFFFLAGITDYSLPFYVIIAVLSCNYNRFCA